MRKALASLILALLLLTGLSAQSAANAAGLTGQPAAPSVEEDGTPVLTAIGVYPCGRQPKQVLFTPDSRYIVMPLLDDTGFDVFSVEEKRKIKRVTPPSSADKGFVEGLFIPEKEAFFVSQMTTGTIYEYSYPGFEYRRSISTDGTWSKFMVWSGETGMIAVSNWVSNDISLISYESGQVVRLIEAEAAPRGLWFIDSGRSLVSLSFEGGAIERFDTETGERTGLISVDRGAMRHIVVNSAETKAYVSDMYWRSVYEVDLASFKISRKIRVFNNPNTIDLLSDRWLFVSCRGPNNPDDYTLRSPVDGQIWVIDTDDMTAAATFEGGNQPTGLDVSPDGKLLCFSNFQDNTIELYEIEQ